jgi:hypothetical protein
MHKICYNKGVNKAPAVLEHPEARPKEVYSLSEGSVPQGSGKHDAPQPPTTVADGPFCELIARDLGVKLSAARTAFIGEPTQRVLGVVSWALDKSEDPEERARMILAWAKKRGCGAFKPPEDEYVSLAGSAAERVVDVPNHRENLVLAKLLARYWHENPKRLARVLDELEIWVNVTDELKKNGKGT